MKNLWKQEGVLLLDGGDLIVNQDLAWATRMGVPGAHEVLTLLDPERAGDLAALELPSKE